MVNTIITVDFNKPVRDPANSSGKYFHNRFHPEIPAVVNIRPGEIFRVECFDCLGGQIKNDDNAADLLEADISLAHVLSGPICVEGTEPGDSLEVEILDIQPIAGYEWGYTAILDPEHGGGFLTERFKENKKAIWDFNGIYASSRHITGVEFVGIIHTGVIATAPSQEMLEEWNRREQELINTDPNRVPALAYPPGPEAALVGDLEGTETGKRVKREGAKTVPPRENGGNVDIKNLSRGSKIWLPVYVPGANLSVGDIHFSEGDGEIAFCGGIEMSGAVTLRTKIIKNGVSRYAMKNPVFIPGITEPRYTKYLSFQGISVDENGKQHYIDASLSYKRAVLNAIAYFKKFGYTEEQICMILSCAPCEGRINCIVDVPNACCTIGVPAEIFKFDVLPSSEDPVSTSRGQLASVK